MASLPDGIISPPASNQNTTPQPDQTSVTNGAVPLASRPQSSQAAHTPEGISQNKERARAVVSSSGLQPTPTPPALNPSKSPANHNSTNHATTQNGTVVGRKRSRSGSRPDGSSANNKTSAEYTKLVVDRYVARDQAHAAARIRDEGRLRALEQELKEERRAWDEYHRRKGIHAQHHSTRPIYPYQRKAPANRKTPTMRFTGRSSQEQAEQLETLCPIRLDIEFEKLRLRDTFTWNVTDQIVPLDHFIHCLIEDFKIPVEAASHFIKEALKSLLEQIEDFHPHPTITEEALDPTSPYSAYKNDEIRVQIKLNITIGQHQLTDQFDWDLNNPANSPEEFARQMARDMSLSGDFTTAIASSIHEQLHPYTKALFMTGHEFDGRVPESMDIRDHILPSPLSSSFRTFTSAKDCAPSFFELDDKNQYAQELSYDREQRQQKRSGNRGIDPRSGRGGGPTLPDLKERPQVNRTRIVASTIPGAAESVDKSGIYRMTQKKKRPWNAGRGMGAADDSDSELEASSSEGESPIRGVGHLLGGGTSRTRGMRGAAAAAQTAMRRNYNERSPSPEVEKSLPPQRRETSLRFKADPIWEDYDSQDERTGLTVKLKMPRERFRQWWREWKKNLPQREQEAAMRLRRHQMEMMQQRASATPGPGQLMGPPHTPGMGGARGLPGTGRAGGGITATPPPGMGNNQNVAPPGPPPPPPTWLAQAVANLRAEYNDDRFEGTMRFNKDAPSGDANQWQPRIRCLDCQGTLYNVDQSDPGLANFRNHLKFSKHLKLKEERKRREASGG